MRTHSRCATVAGLALVVLCVGPGAADPVASMALESTMLLQTLIAEIAKSLKAQADDLTRQRAELVRRRDAATDHERHELTEEIEELDLRITELTSQKTLAEGNKTAWAVHSGLSTLYTTLGQMEQSMGQLDTWGPSIVDLDLMAADQLASMRGRPSSPS